MTWHELAAFLRDALLELKIAVVRRSADVITGSYAAGSMPIESFGPPRREVLDAIPVVTA